MAITVPGRAERGTRRAAEPNKLLWVFMRGLLVCVTREELQEFACGLTEPPTWL
jgi:hypothetical protein